MQSLLSYDKPRPESTAKSERVSGLKVFGRIRKTKPERVHKMMELVVYKRNDAEQRFDISTRLVSSRVLTNHQRKNQHNPNKPDAQRLKSWETATIQATTLVKKRS